MTLQELIDNIIPMVNFGGDVQLAKELFDKFSNKNVVIQKGNKRHNDAEILHKWIEGAKITASCDNKYFHDVSSAKDKLRGKYYINKCNNKPSKDNNIFEWQFRYEDESTIVVTKFMTHDELLSKELIHGIPSYMYIKKTETKRARA